MLPLFCLLVVVPTPAGDIVNAAGESCYRSRTWSRWGAVLAEGGARTDSRTSGPCRCERPSTRQTRDRSETGRPVTGQRPVPHSAGSPVPKGVAWASASLPVQDSTGQRPVHQEQEGGGEEYSLDDWRQVLREAIELVDDGDSQAALLALQRLISKAGEDALRAVDQDCRRLRGMPLDEFTVRIRLQVARRADRAGVLEVRFVSPYEADAFGRIAEEMERELLDRQYAGRRLADWPAGREQYTELRPDARAMVDDLRLAAALISARLRFDPRMRAASPARRELMAQRAELMRFAAQVAAIPGFTSLDQESDADDPTLRAAARLAAEQAAASRPASSQPADQPEAERQERRP